MPTLSVFQPEYCGNMFENYGKEFHKDFIDA
jgi:hypothetical protein